MKPYLFVIGDVHGQYDLMMNLLKDYDPRVHQLVFIGDLIDRGPKSVMCMRQAKQLVETDQAIYLKGNHEDYLLRFLADPEGVFERYLLNGGKATIEGLLHQGATAEYSPTEMAMMIRSREKELIAFLEALPYVYEWNDYLCVHAGVNLALSDWRNTTPHDFLWIREPFHHLPNQTGKTIVFGHTITQALAGDNESTALWQHDRKIGIDSGATYGGVLHGVIFDKTTLLQDISYPNYTDIWAGER